MVTANQLVYDVLNIASSGITSDDFRITPKQVLFWCSSVRSQLIAQAIQKKADHSDIWIQTIGCLELEQADISDCCSVDTGCIGLRSVQLIPETVEVDKNNLVLSVTGLDGSPFAKLNQFNARYKKYNKYTSKRIGWFIKNSRLYVVNSKVLKKVTLKGIFEDPSDLENFVDCSGESCFSLDGNYPVSRKMANMITDIVVKTKVLPLMQFPSDKSNDALNETQSGT